MLSLRNLALATALAAATLSMPGAARAEDPPVRYPPSSVRTKLIVGGVLLTGVGYGAAFLGAEAAPTWPGADEALKVPIIGPWWTLAKNGCPPEDEDCDAFVFLRAGLLVVDGLMQAAGLAIVAEAIFMKTEATPSAPAKAALGLGSPRRGSAWNFSWKPAPIVTPNVTGFGLVGTF